MSRARISDRLRELSRVRVASPSLFHRHVVVPQVFVFVVLLAGGTLFGDGLTEVAQRCAVVVYLVFTGIAIRRLLPYISLRIYIAHLVGTLIFIHASALGLRIDPISSSYLPSACLILLLPLLSLSKEALPLLAVSLLLVVVGMLTVDMTLFGGGSDNIAVTVSIAAYSLGMSLFSALAVLLLRARAPERAVTGSAAGISESMSHDERDKHVNISSDDQLAFQRAQRYYVRELRGQFTARVVLVSVWNLVFLLSPIRQEAIPWWPYAFVIAALFIGEFVLVRAMRRARHERDFFLAAATIAVLHPCLWIILASNGFATSPFATIVLISSTIGFLSLCWPGSTHLVLCAWYVGLMAVDLFLVDAVTMRLIIYATSLLLAVSVGRWAYRMRMTQLGHKLMRLAAEATPPAPIMLRLVAWSMGRLVDARRALLVRAEVKSDVSDGSPEAEVITDATAIPSSVDRLFLRGLVQRVIETSVHDEERERRASFDLGVLPFTVLGEQYIVPMLSWFATVPRTLCFTQLRAPFGEREVSFFVIVPLSRWTRALAWVGEYRRLLEALREVLAIPRFYLLSSVHRLQSADQLLASEQTASQRDEELNQVVHIVNNCAQEISVHCENLRGALPPESTAGASFDSGSARQQVDSIEVAARALSHGVSDVRLLREMAVSGSQREREVVSVNELFESVDAYMAYHCRRRGVSWRIEMPASSESGVRVAQRDLASVALRTACMLALSRLGRDRRMELRVHHRDSTVRILVCDDALQAYEVGRFQREGFLSNMEGDPLQRTRVLALERFVTASEGTLSLEHETDWLPHRMVISLEGGQLAPAAKIELPRSRWILLVDDNPQVTMFYAMVAEALTLPHRTAASFKEAQALLDECGKPQLVVTDVQLGDGSGLDLVRSLRERFGTQLPVIVVTGETLAPTFLGGLSEEGKRMTKVLTKPVGRRRLFVELQDLLAESAEVEHGK